MKKILTSLLLTLLWLPAHALDNRLDGNPSPYLAMHGQDPTAWQEWGPEAFDLARREGRLLFVSVGYFACHWCHVMQRESYQNPEIAALLNQHFVPIKIDRELLPDIDQRLMDFAERTRGRGGWPLNVFLTPEGYPVLALLYTPADRFLRQIQFLNQQWQRRPDQISDIAKQAQAALATQIAEEQATEDGKAMSRDALRNAYVRRALSVADELSGGFGNQAKFPSAPQLDTLLSLYAEMGPDQHYREEIHDFLDTTLDRMSRLGLHDEIAGGFFRYTVDPDWHTPHYEKMLYDNAQLAAVYVRAAEVLAEPRWLKVAKSTLDFLLRELALSPGDATQGFAASLSALDKTGHEGGGYLWTPAELASLLTPEQQALAGALWGMQGKPEHDGRFLPRRVGDLADYPESAVAMLRERLFVARQQRALPRDNKILVAWNAQALRAFALYLKQHDSAPYRQAAQDLYGLLTRDILAKPTGVDSLRNALDASGDRAALADYAYLARALLDWALLDWAEVNQADIRPGAKSEAKLEAIRLSETLVRAAWAQFHSPEGWRLSHDALLNYGVARRVPPDGAMPSAAAVLMEAASRLLAQGRLQDLSEDLAQALEQARGWTGKHPFWGASFVPML